MLREITIGQYYATDSLLHRLDPRVKIAGTLLYIISLFLVHHYIGLVVAALIFGVMVRMSNVPFRFIVKGLKPIMMMLVFTALLHLFCTPGILSLQSQSFLLSACPKIRRDVLKCSLCGLIKIFP